MTFKTRVVAAAAAFQPYAVAVARALAPYAPFISAAVRTALVGAGGGLVAGGYLSRAQEEQGVGVILVAAGAAWSQWQKAHAGAKLQAAIDAPAGLAKPTA